LGTRMQLVYYPSTVAVNNDRMRQFAQVVSTARQTAGQCH